MSGAVFATLALALAATEQVPVIEPADIIVTAQGREQPLEEVPASVTSVSAATIEKLRLQTLEDVARYTPGFFADAQETRNPDLVIRGISTDLPEVTAEPRVSVFLDGVPFSRRQASLGELFDVERVEVIRGPQSTLFGRAALIGAINIVQQRADPSGLSALIEAEAGSFGSRRIDGVVNLPIAADTAVRVAGRIRRTDGVVDNLLGERLDGRRSEAVRGALHFEPAPSVRVDLFGSHQHDRYTGRSLQSAVFAPADPATGAGTGRLDPYGPAALRPVDGFAGGPLGASRRLTSATALLNAEPAAGWTVASTTGWVDLSTREVADYDATGLAIATAGDDLSGRQFTQDLRVRHDGDVFGVTLGASFFHERLDRGVGITLDERELLALLTGVLNRGNPQLQPEAFYRAPALVARQLQGLVAAVGGALPDAQAQAIAANLGVHSERYSRSSATDAVDVYGDVTLRPAPAIELQAGLRYGHDRKTSGFAGETGTRTVLAALLGALRQSPAVRAGLLQLLAAPNAATRPPSATYPLPLLNFFFQPTASPEGDRDTISSGGASWRLSARYAPGAGVSGYVTYARGRRPEVLSVTGPTVPGSSANFAPQPAETIDSLELGARLRRGTLRLDVAAYGYRYSNFQTQVQQGTQFIDTDAGRATTFGVEAEGRWTPAPPLELFLAYAFTRSRFGTGLYEGNRFRLVPDHQLSLGGTFTRPFARGEATVTPVLQYRSRLFFDDSNGDPSLLQSVFIAPGPFPTSQGPVALLGLHLGYTQGRVSARLHGENLLNRRYLRDGGGESLFLGLPSTRAGLPRTIFASLAWRY